MTISAFSENQNQSGAVRPFTFNILLIASQYLPNKHRDVAKLFPCLSDFKRSSSKMFHRRLRKVAGCCSCSGLAYVKLIQPCANLLEDGIVEGNRDKVTGSSRKHTLLVLPNQKTMRQWEISRGNQGDPFCSVYQPVSATSKSENSDKAPTNSHQTLWKYTMVQLNPMV